MTTFGTFAILAPAYIGWLSFFWLGVLGMICVTFRSRGNDLWYTAGASALSLAASTGFAFAIWWAVQ